MTAVERPGLLRVVWLPGSDLLEGTCHCGAVHVAEGPIEVWEWLLGHPVGHHAAGAGADAGAAVSAPAHTPVHALADGAR
ncbi:hypothetical protein [Spirillospora sp. NPDC047279]|uniref:hypothetical protein n=1 Tax=Spirillospora sp. NPDC047279 TaxID=3155478 RepID=UPI0033DEBBB5